MSMTGLGFIVPRKLAELFTLSLWPSPQTLMSQESKSKTIASKQKGSGFSSGARTPGDLSWVYPSSHPEHWRMEGWKHGCRISVAYQRHTDPSGICWQILHKLPIYLLSGWRHSGAIFAPCRPGPKRVSYQCHRKPSKLTSSHIFPPGGREIVESAGLVQP